MTTNDQDRLIPLELTLDTLTWLRDFLYEESLNAEIDNEEVASLHTDAAIRAAKEVLGREHAQMTKIVAAIDETLKASAAHESLARKIAAMTPPVA